jgi:hypothetical protein
MGREASSRIAPELTELQGRFAQWRRNKRRGARIPEDLWQAATALGEEVGVSQVSQTLGLSYHTLKRRVLENGPPERQRELETASPAFIEFPLEVVTPTAQCVIEIERAGCKLTLRLSNHRLDEVTPLVEGLWRSGR